MKENYYGDDYHDMQEEMMEVKEYGLLYKRNWKETMAFACAVVVVVTTAGITLHAKKDDIKNQKDVHAIVEVLNDEELSYLKSDENLLELEHDIAEATDTIVYKNNGEESAYIAQSDSLVEALKGESQEGSLMGVLDYCRAIQNNEKRRDLTEAEQQHALQLRKQFVEYELPVLEDYLLSYAKSVCMETLISLDNETFARENFNKITLEDHRGKVFNQGHFVLSLANENGLNTEEKYRIPVESDERIGDAIDAYYEVGVLKENINYEDRRNVYEASVRVQRIIANMIVNDKNVLNAVEDKEGNLSLNEGYTYVKNNTIYQK